MRILHVIPAYRPAFRYGGPTFSVSCLAEGLANAGAEVWVFTTTANGSEELDVPTGVPVEVEGVQVVYFRRWTGDHGHFCPALWLALWRQGAQFDVVHIHSWWNWVAFGAALVCRLRGFRMVFSPHGMLSPYTLRSRGKQRFQRLLGRWLLAPARWLATTQMEQRELHALEPSREIAHLPNIVPLPTTSDAPSMVPRPEGPVQLLYLSRIDPKKGVDFLIETLANIDANANWRLVVAGDATSAYGYAMQRLVHQKGLQAQVHWHGWVSGADKWRLLAEADLLVLPSHNENFALVVLEALAVGTPVVISDQVGLYDYVCEQDLGWVAPLSIETWRKTLSAALSDVPKRQRIRQQAPARVQRDFDAATLVRRYLDFYQRRTVHIIFRKPCGPGFYSIERSFGALWPYLQGNSNIQIQKIVACAPSRGLWPRLRIAAQMRRLKADVFHISGDIHFAALFLPGHKTLLTVHDCGFMKHPSTWKRFLLEWLWLQWPVRHCRQIVAVSEATKADILRYTGCSPDKIEVIPSAILPRFQPLPKPFNSRCPRVLHVGATPNKNLQRHIEALAGIPCILHIAGRIGPEEQSLLQRCGVAYECTPDLDDESMARAYEACDMLLFASTFEGFGMPILEAQAVGRPVVTASVSSMPAVAGEGGACFVNPFEVADIRRGVLRVIEDADFRESLIKKGFENVKRFRAAAAAAAYVRLYQALM
ncbi:MAG: glycosyltransferase [Saprospiraceae bacterium]|nr:glycosyltransferase [Saprospiraceae bacterium]MDW8230545.1 glycosyltransferase [Saprospiraceae bacterium]